MSIVSVGMQVLVLVVMVSGFIKIMKNDLFHLTADVKEIKGTVKEIKDTQGEQGNRLTKMETQCKERHSRRKRNKIK